MANNWQNGGVDHNWNTASNWSDGVPTADDDVVFPASTTWDCTINAAAVCRSIDCSAYDRTITHAAAITLSIGDATAPANASALNFSGGWTYNLGSATTSAITFLSTNATTQTITWGSKTTGNITFDGVGASWQFADDLTATAATITLNKGTLNTNSKAISISNLSSSSSNTRTLTLDNSTINISATSGTGWNMAITTSLTFNANTSTINFSGATIMNVGATAGPTQTFNIVNFTGSGTPTLLINSTTFASLTRTGTAAKTDTFEIRGNATITGTLTLTGNSAINRLLVYSSTIGTARTVTAAAVDLDNVDFQDITAAGAAIPFTGVSLGDCGGNTNITTDAPVDQYWVNDATGDWDTSANWTSRVPLPQDNVYVSRDFATTKIITVDMPRMGKDISFAGATNTPTVLMNVTGLTYTIYGSLNLTDVGTFTHSKNTFFQGRVNSSLTSNGKSFGASVYVQVPSLTFTISDTFNNTGALFLSNGTFTVSGSVGINAYSFQASSGTTVNMGGGTWALNSSVSTAWLATGVTINKETANINLTGTNNTTNLFVGGTNSYNNITIAPSATLVTTFSGAFTFANMTMASAGTKTVKFTKSTTYTMTGSSFLQGTADSPTMIIDSTTLNGGFETLGGGGADVFLNWTEGVAGTSTVNAEAGADRYAGTYSCRFDVDASNNTARVYQAVLTVGKQYKVTYYAKSSSGTPYILVGDLASRITPITTSWVKYTQVFVATSTTFYVSKDSGCNSLSIYIDNITLQESNYIIINSDDGVTNFTLTNLTAAQVSTDYLDLSRSTVTQTNFWYAGINSNNVVNNINWVFTAPPSGHYFQFIHNSLEP